MTNEKLSLKKIKQLPPSFFLRLINKMKKKLKNDEVMQALFKKYNTDIEELEYYPMKFGDIDVSATTNHGVITYNYTLLIDGDFEKNYGYAIHEVCHVLQQTTGDRATRSSDDGSYLDNPHEQEGFTNQVEYIANHRGEEEAEEYVDNLLDHHEIDNKKEIKEKKEILLSKV